MTSIFIIYSSKDVKIAEMTALMHGETNQEIAYELSRQDVALILWSEDSSNSQWVKNEWITARAVEKPIFLVVFAALDRLPLPLRNLEAIVVNNNDIDSDIKQKLIKKINDSATNIEYDYKIFPPNRDIPYDPPDFRAKC